MLTDAVRVSLVVASFAALVTVHVASIAGVVRRSRHPIAAVPLLVALPPLVPLLAMRDRLWLRATLWGVLAVVYVVAFALAR